MVTLDDDDARIVTNLVDQLIRERAVAGRPIAYELRAFHRRLDAAVEVSSRRQSAAAHREELGVSRIGTRQAAALLGWGVRRTQRHAADLGGELVADRLTFDERTVREYAEALQSKEIHE
jgi:hypothetical protein